MNNSCAFTVIYVAPQADMLQMEFDVLPTKVLKEDKAEYIQALIDTREHEDINIFIDCMTRLHCQHLKADIDHYIESTSEKMVDKQALRQKMVDKWVLCKDVTNGLVDDNEKHVKD